MSGVWFSLADPHRHPPCCLSDINNSTRNPRENGNRQMDQLWPRRPQWTAGISSVSRLSRYLQNGVDIYTDIYPMPRPASALDPGLHLSQCSDVMICNNVTLCAGPMQRRITAAGQVRGGGRCCCTAIIILLIMGQRGAIWHITALTGDGFSILRNV